MVLRTVMRSGGVRIAVAGGAMVGNRDEQQDASIFRPLPDGSFVMVLADGMGGHAGGALAARIVVETCVAHVAAEVARGVPASSAMTGAMSLAVERMAHAMREDHRLLNMGATLVLAMVTATHVTWLSIGDSPMWLCRDGVLSRLNEDHSLRESEAAVASGKGNVLLSVVNGEEPHYIDLADEPLPLKAGDRIIIASDGVLTIDEDEIAAIAGAGGVETEVVDRLLLAVSAARKPRQDNCTVVVADVRGAEAGTMPADNAARGGLLMPVIVLGGLAGVLSLFAVYYALFG